MKNSSATFQRLMTSVILELEGCDVYMNELIIYSNTLEDHLLRLRALFDRLTKAKLTVNFMKSQLQFVMGQVTYLGHVVCSVQAKVDNIAHFPSPQK